MNEDKQSGQGGKGGGNEDFEDLIAHGGKSDNGDK